MSPRVNAVKEASYQRQRDSSVKSRIKKLVLRCPSLKRAVEIEFRVSGSWLAPKYEVIYCPAMRDGNESCNRQCAARLFGVSSGLIGESLLLPGLSR